MIWCIIGVTLFILAFVFGKLDDICNTETDVFEALCVGSLIISLIIIAISSVSIIMSHTYAAEAGIQKAKDQHDAYIMLLEENKDITVQNQLYKDIIEYNTTLRKTKHYRKSLWTNWFYAEGWDELEYIEINNYY